MILNFAIYNMPPSRLSSRRMLTGAVCGSSCRSELGQFGDEMVKQAGAIAWLVGLAALIAIATWSGWDAVGHAVVTVGWGILLVVLVRVVTVSVAGTGWWLLFPLKMRPRLKTCIALRFIREAANVLLPLAQIGGDLIGAGLLTLYAVPGPLAAASVIVDVLLQAATQFLFALIGLLVLIGLGGDMAVAWVAALGLGLAGAALVGFYLVQRRGGQRILHFVIDRFTGDRKWRALATVDAVYHNLAAIYAQAGQKEKALALLQRHFFQYERYQAVRSKEMMEARVDAVFASLIQDPAFLALTKDADGRLPMRMSPNARPGGN